MGGTGRSADHVAIMGSHKAIEAVLAVSTLGLRITYITSWSSLTAPKHEPGHYNDENKALHNNYYKIMLVPAYGPTSFQSSGI